VLTGAAVPVQTKDLGPGRVEVTLPVTDKPAVITIEQ
jgi:hypothetical protein